MLDIIKRLKDNQLIDNELSCEISEEKRIVQEESQKLMKVLEEKLNKRKSWYVEIAEDEQKILNEIKLLMRNPIFKRAYKNKKYRDSIDELLNLLKGSRIEVTKGKKALKYIYQSLADIIERQRQIEDSQLKDIKSSIGNKMWNDYEDIFKSDKFLNAVMNCK